jgi:hypothetical protein
MFGAINYATPCSQRTGGTASGIGYGLRPTNSGEIEAIRR